MLMHIGEHGIVDRLGCDDRRRPFTDALGARIRLEVS
jgi:hypothetical protein